MENHHEIKIAVLEEQIKGLREQHKAHALKTDESLKELFGQNRDILKAVNEGRGAYKFAMFVSSVIGAGVTTIFHSFMGK